MAARSNLSRNMASSVNDTRYESHTVPHHSSQMLASSAAARAVRARVLMQNRRVRGRNAGHRSSCTHTNGESGEIPIEPITNSGKFMRMCVHARVQDPMEAITSQTVALGVRQVFVVLLAAWQEGESCMHGSHSLPRPLAQTQHQQPRFCFFCFATRSTSSKTC